MSESVVYILRAGDNGLVKIGYSRQLRARIRGLQTGAGAELRVLRTIPGGRGIEAWLHDRFSDGRKHNEWFEFHPDMMSVQPPPEEEVKKVKVERSELEAMIHAKMQRWVKIAVGLHDDLLWEDAIAAAANDLEMTPRRLKDLYFTDARGVWADEFERVQTWFEQHAQMAVARHQRAIERIALDVTGIETSRQERDQMREDETALKAMEVRLAELRAKVAAKMREKNGGPFTTQPALALGSLEAA